MGAKIFLSLLLAISVQGIPNNIDEYYNDQYKIDDYSIDYGLDDTPVNDADNAITNIHKPTIISNPVKLDVDNGMTIRLPCNVDQLPDTVSIIWSKEDPYNIIAMGKHIMGDYSDRANVMVDDKGSVLTIGIAKNEDAGKYKCSVAVSTDDTKNPVLKHDVNIRDIINSRAPPSVDLSTPQFLEVTKGDDVTLNCRASGGNPAPTVKWSRVGKMMPDGRADIEQESVTFTQVSRKHAGTYKCTASNGYGKEAVKEVVVDVNYAPEIEITEMFIHSQTGQDKVELICNVHAHPAPSVIWEKDGNLVVDNQRVRPISKGSKHTLIITYVKSEDFGKYACKASNSLGSQQKVIELTGHASPAQFKSSASGSSENSFLIEWSSSSFTPITKFKLEIKERNSNNWKSYNVDAHQDETAINHWAGKQYLSDLKGATQYKARVSAENDEGWSKPGKEWNFATLGAVPSPASVRGSAASISSTAMILISCLVLSWRM